MIYQVVFGGTLSEHIQRVVGNWKGQDGLTSALGPDRVFLWGPRASTVAWILQNEYGGIIRRLEVQEWSQS